MTPPPFYPPGTRWRKGSTSYDGVGSAASSDSSTMQGQERLQFPSDFGNRFYYSPSEPIHQYNFDGDEEYNPSVLLGSDPFSSNIYPAYTYSSPVKDGIHDFGHGSSSVPTENPAMIDVLQTNDVIASHRPSTVCPSEIMDAIPNVDPIFSSGQYIAEHPPTAPGTYNFANIPGYGVILQTEALFPVRNPFMSNFVPSAAGTNSSTDAVYTGGFGSPRFAQLPLHTASPPQTYPTTWLRQASSMGQGMDTDGQSSTVPGASTFLGIPAGRGIAYVEAHSTIPAEKPPTFNTVHSAVGTSKSSHAIANDGAGSQVVQNPHYIVVPTSKQYVSSSETPTYVCRWRDAKGHLCGAKFTVAMLSGHLADPHGIRGSRDDEIKCHWSGCKKAKPMNRESILRHVKEVHLRIKRPPKRVLAQEPNV